MKKFLAALLCLTLALSLVAVSFAESELKTIKVGATAAPHAEILESEAVATKLAELGYKLDVVVYDGYSLENPAVSDGTDDCNYFQHYLYLADYNSSVGEADQLVAAFAVHYEPFGVYSSNHTSLDELEDGMTIALPNDPSNETRALFLLAQAGYITLPEGATGADSLTKQDIVENPRNLKFEELEASILPSTMVDYDYSVINGNFAIDAGLKIEEALLAESAEDTAITSYYANILAIRAADVDADWVKALQTALCSEEVKTYIQENYNGGVVAMF